MRRGASGVRRGACGVRREELRCEDLRCILKVGLCSSYKCTIPLTEGNLLTCLLSIYLSILATPHNPFLF